MRMKGISDIKKGLLNQIEIVLLTNLYLFIDKKEDLINSIIKYSNDEDYKQVIESARELSYLKYNKIFKNLKDQFWDNARPEILAKIVKNEPFESEYNWSSESNIIIDQIVLKRFCSSDNIGQNTPKAHIAKQLGATIIA